MPKQQPPVLVGSMIDIDVFVEFRIDRIIHLGCDRSIVYAGDDLMDGYTALRHLALEIFPIVPLDWTKWGNLNVS